MARVKIEVDSAGQFVYKIGCSVCVVRDRRNWSAYRSGEDNGFMASMDRWVFHLAEKHPEDQSPCMAYLGAAQQRVQERRDRSQV